MPSRVNWGILGNSTIGRVCVLPAIHKSNNGRIKALGTRRPDQAAELARVNQIERVYDSYDQVIADPEIDAVYIPLPNHLHLSWTIKALHGGKHVLCEKPLACNAADARVMAAAAKSNDRLLMEALMYRFHPRSHRVKAMVTNGAIGRVRLVRAAFCFTMEPNLLEKGGNYRLDETVGGGALLDVGTYVVSIARWLLGEEPLTVQAQAIFPKRFKVDIHAVGSMRFASEALATFEVSFCSGLQQTYTIVGSDGVIELPHDAFIPWEKDAIIEWRKKDEESGEKIVIPGADEYQLMVEHFSTAVLQGEQLEVLPEETIANLEVLDALALAAHSCQTTSVAS